MRWPSVHVADRLVASRRIVLSQREQHWSRARPLTPTLSSGSDPAIKQARPHEPLSPCTLDPFQRHKVQRHKVRRQRSLTRSRRWSTDRTCGVTTGATCPLPGRPSICPAERWPLIRPTERLPRPPSRAAAPSPSHRVSPHPQTPAGGDPVGCRLVRTNTRGLQAGRARIPVH